MKEVIRKEYYSKSGAFLLPLTGLSKSQKYPLYSYLFWGKYSIEDYNLVLLLKYDDYNEFLDYCLKVLLPTLTKNGLMEIHDYDKQSVMIVDMSVWGFDVDMFLAGKYSKMSAEAHMKISNYHERFENGERIRPAFLTAALYPNKKDSFFDGMTPIEYACRPDVYGFDLKELQKLGELASLYDKENETLTEINCQDDVSLPKV